MKYVTYLIGAGASANCLPLVKYFDEGMEKLITCLNEDQYQLSNTEYFTTYTGKTKRQIQENFINNLEWLISECKNHANIDTYAKKLYIKDQFEDLKKLKVTLSVFLVLMQCKKTYDKRYDTFFASILKNFSHELPKNIKIISWNYDFQFERAFAEFRDDYSLKSISSILNIKTKYSNVNYKNNDSFCICKVNGTTSILKYPDEIIPYTKNLNSAFNLESIETALKNYASQLFSNNSEQYYSELSFAWENRSGGDNIITSTKIATSETNILVVIGYSFPFFNREIDRDIIGNMKKLEKVYFQAPDAKNLVERFESIRPDIDIKKLVPRFDIDQFLLPNEL